MIQKKQFILAGVAGKVLNGDVIYDDTHTILATIIFIHGFKGFKDWGAHHLTAQFFAEKGYRFIKFNLSHSGVTSEKPSEVSDMEAFASNTLSYELRDVETIMDYAAHTFTEQPIYLIGHSRGGGIAILEAAKNTLVKKVVTWSAIDNLSSLWKKEQEADWRATGTIYVENARTKEKMPLHKNLLEDFEAHREAYDILKAAKNVTIPWLILHGDQDVNVDFSVAQRLAQAQPSATLQKIEGANHVYGASHPYTSDQLPPQLQEVCTKTLTFFGAPLQQ
ncbi:alpha/beta hydrolase family protein [Pedobacter duraquae]|uniref:Alpha-beta hydrolase superfamily lysophospholipase n=1 Tax=Pedobacter duraquae TaxID=425511 RepID=A0A4R6IM61_9SPHI|nr:alpha/beta fold hydrolase [Pedobacter duraquae]TDO23232.1 alpha-beta hydrolase superfamily lysophospholipase [Pedobacter duraquae]